MFFELDPASLARIHHILTNLNLPYINKDYIFCVRSKGSKSRAIARIYSFPRPIQIALNTKPSYVIETITERFDKLSQENKDRVLIHELMHIPKTFSGSLVPHKCFGRKLICEKTVEVLYKEFVKSCTSTK